MWNPSLKSAILASGPNSTLPANERVLPPWVHGPTISRSGALGLAQADVVEDRAAGVGVVPAGEVEHRDVGGLLVVRRPVPIGMLPVVVVLGVGEDLVVVVLEGRLGGQRVLAARRRDVADPRLGLFGGVQLAEHPRGLLRQLEGAVVAHLVEPAVVQAAHVEDGGLEVRRMEDRGAGLGVGGIRRAPHRHLTVDVRLGCQPFNGVVAILAVADVLALHALGVERAALVLQDDDVAVAGKGLRLRHQGLALLVVGRALQQRGQLRVDGDAVHRRPVDVGGQLDAVAHRHHDLAALERLRPGVRSVDGASHQEETNHASVRRSRHGEPPIEPVVAA